MADRARPPARAPVEAPASSPARRSSRSEAKDAAARAELVPLADGERPRAIAIGALVALLLAVANIVAYLVSLAGNDPRPALGDLAPVYSAVLALLAVGMWRVRAWGVLGMQALLTMTMIFFSLIAFKAGDLATLAICIAIVGSSGWLFWSLVRPLARIQMPQRAPE